GRPRAGDVCGRRRQHHADRQSVERDGVQRESHRHLHHGIQRGSERTRQNA
ncbi:hypothetical protein M9458_039232, partial [Cirrhinus mrigala]